MTIGPIIDNEIKIEVIYVLIILVPRCETVNFFPHYESFKNELR